MFGVDVSQCLSIGVGELHDATILFPAAVALCLRPTLILQMPDVSDLAVLIFYLHPIPCAWPRLKPLEDLMGLVNEGLDLSAIGGVDVMMLALYVSGHGWPPLNVWW